MKEMPGEQGRPPSSAQLAAVREAALAAATQPGQPALLPADLDRVRTSDQYIVRAWKHVFGTDQKFSC